MDDSKRTSLLKSFNNDQMEELTSFFKNRYPLLDVEFQIADEKNIFTGESVSLNLKFNFDDEITIPINSPFFPKQKFEEWWVLIGDITNNKLISIKRLSILKISSNCYTIYCS